MNLPRKNPLLSTAILFLFQTVGLAGQRWERNFVGAIGETIPIHMQLVIDDYDPGSGFHRFSGSLFYDKYQAEIALTGGTDSFPSGIQVWELNSKGQAIGLFSGSLDKDETFSGTWSKPNGSSSKPFLLKNVPTFDRSQLKKGLSPALTQLLIARKMCSQQAESSDLRPEMQIDEFKKKAICGHDPCCLIVSSYDPQIVNNHRLELFQATRIPLVAEIWLLVYEGNRFVRKQILVRDTTWGDAFHEETNDPQESGTSITISANHVLFSKRYGSRGASLESATLSLDPTRILLEEHHHHQPAGGPDTFAPYFDLSWNWTSFQGEGTHTNLWSCEKTQQDSNNRDERQFLVIPRVDMNDEFRQDGWKNALLGSCALGLDRSSGFILQGTPETLTFQQSIKILLISDHELLVDVSTITFHGESSNWLNNDHLEIWQDGQQWGIQLSDGKVYAAAGHPSHLPTVQKVIKTSGGQPSVTGLKITLTKPVQQVPGLGISYSASDQGRSVKYLLSTSEICFFHPEDVSFVKQIESDAATCMIQDGMLSPTWSDSYSPEMPILDWKDHTGIMSADWNPDLQHYQ
jgi:hypothetical protein